MQKIMMIPANYKKDDKPTYTTNPDIKLPEMNNSSIEDKIFSADDVRFMLQLRQSINGID
jgi:hypothetical protein